MKILIVTRLDIDRMPGFRYGRAFSHLGNIVTYQHFTNIEDKGFDIAVFDDNADYHQWPKLNCPCFYIAVDTTIEGGRRCAHQSKNMDFVFFAQKIAQDKFDPKRSEWCPNASDTLLDSDLPIKDFNNRKWVVASIGNFDKRRERNNIKNILRSEYGEKCLIINDISYNELPKIYNNAKFIINPNLGDCNLRLFESCTYGAICINQDTAKNGVEDLGFRHRKNYLSYYKDEEVIPLIENYIDTDSKIGERGLKLIRGRHSYIHRAKRMLAIHKERFS